MGGDLAQLNFEKEGNKFHLICQMSSRPQACLWLDRLLTMRDFKKKFSIPHSQTGQAAKMKIYIEI